MFAIAPSLSHSFFVRVTQADRGPESPNLSVASVEVCAFDLGTGFNDQRCYALRQPIDKAEYHREIN